MLDRGDGIGGGKRTCPALLETNGLNPTPRRVALSGIADKVSVIRDFLGTALGRG